MISHEKRSPRYELAGLKLEACGSADRLLAWLEEHPDHRSARDAIRAYIKWEAGAGGAQGPIWCTLLWATSQGLEVSGLPALVAQLVQLHAE